MMPPALALTFAATALAAAIAARAGECPPGGRTTASLQALKAAKWELPAREREALAIDLADCLGDPDPRLRDDLAIEALSTWMRGGRLAPATLHSLRTRLLADLASPPDPAGFRQPFAALTLDIIFEIAWHRGDDFDFVRSKEIREVFLTRLLQNSEVAAVHHFDAELACLNHKVVKMRVELRRAASDVEGGDAAAFEKIQHDADDVSSHFFGTRRPGIDVAMEARLVAAIADIDLQRVELGPADRGEGNLVEQRQHIAHGHSLIAAGSLPFGSLFRQRAADRCVDAEAPEARQLQRRMA